MHNRLLVTLDAPADAGSEQVRKDVFNRLMQDNSFCGEGGRFGSPLCDWFLIGGRWSGLLADTLIGGEFNAKARALPGMDTQFIPQSIVENNASELDTIWHSLGGTGPNPYSRSSYLQHGYADDAMVISEALYDILLAANEGCDNDGEGFADLDGDEVNRDFVGRKWLVVVDYHN
ncbi:MAG TPA: hypothetical protein VG826_26260 [Pirellulales bacterium]|nr:hypothetical protein [Pirellulales bacterium]